jgi:undecaprenyl-diphosphatase
MSALSRLLREWLEALGIPRLLVAVATVLGLLCLAPGLIANPEPVAELVILDQVHRLIPPQLGELLVRVYQLSGVHVSAILVLAMLIFLGLRRYWAELVCLVIGTGGILVLVDRCFKPLFDRARPTDRLLEDISGRSFPSGHAAGSVVFYFLSCSLLAAHYPSLRRPLFVMASIWVGLVWLSTLQVRAHWPSDILAGAALGYVWLSFCLAGLTVWERHQSRRSASAASLSSRHG